MGKPTGFIEFDRMDESRRDPTARVGDWNEFLVQIDEKDLQTQGARCMDCGVPYCHNGCPVNNQIPDWNDLTYNGLWSKMIQY